ncbi:MAG: type II toxin-antitoxin system VapC family toxin [Deltaproteobacteria bacterium]|nr:type II toxin-antitoxin system VapC family toxin [Deltaproteobacteria bacterium]
MILYLDTSALVKRYFREPCSDEVLSRWKSATLIVTSFVAYAETMASIYRKKRETNLADLLIRRIVDSFQEDWESFIRVEVNAELNRYIGRLVERHPLRGFDAIHLASAILIHERLHEDFLFVCFDERLNGSARSEGLETFPG